MRSMILIPLSLIAAVSSAIVGAEAPAPASPAEVRYVPLQPAFVCNFGVADNGHLMYLKTDVTIRVSSRDAEMAARNHMPALRNSLVLLLSRQDEASVSTGAGRDAIRAQALQEINAILQAEEGEAVDDLMFTNFIVQR